MWLWMACQSESWFGFEHRETLQGKPFCLGKPERENLFICRTWHARYQTCLITTWGVCCPFEEANKIKWATWHSWNINWSSQYTFHVWLMNLQCASNECAFVVHDPLLYIWEVFACALVVYFGCAYHHTRAVRAIGSLNSFWTYPPFPITSCADCKLCAFHWYAHFHL